MSVRREDAVVNQQLDLRFEFRYDRLGELFDPSSITKVEILDSDHSTVLQTITTASIVKLDTGLYQVIANAITTEKKIYDRWTHIVDGITYVLESNAIVLDTSSPSDGMASFVSLVKLKVQDKKSVLADPSDYETLIQEALKHYSRLRPQQEVEKLVGDGNAYFAVPTNWENYFSEINNIEFPLEQNPPSYIGSNEYRVEEVDTGMQVRFVSTNYPNNDDNFYLRYTRRHTITASANSLPAFDKDAFCLLCAYYCCLTIANYYSGTSDPTIDADVVSYRTRGDEFTARANKYLEAFKEKVKPYVTGVIGEWDLEAFWGTTFLNRDQRNY